VGTETYPALETLDDVSVIRLSASGFGRSSFIGKLSDYITYYLALAWKLITIRPKPDIILALTTPPYIGLLAKIAAKLRGCRHAHWIMDLYPDVMVSHGILREDSLTHRILSAATRFELRGSSATIALGPDMVERVDQHTKRSAHDKAAAITWVPMWADPIHVPWNQQETPAPRGEWGWHDDEVILLYSGNMGLGHRFGEFLAAAARLPVDISSTHKVRFAFSGGGKRKTEIEEFAGRHPDAPIDIFPYVNRERLNGHFASADVMLVSLDPTWDGCMVPSKLQGIFAVGKPVILVGSESSSAAQWIKESHGGWVVPPNDIDALVQAIREASGEEERVKRGQAALEYGNRHFDQTLNSNRICDLLESN